jgi:hypothetical protein
LKSNLSENPAISIGSARLVPTEFSFLAYSSPLKLKATGSFKLLVMVYQTTWRRIEKIIFFMSVFYSMATVFPSLQKYIDESEQISAYLSGPYLVENVWFHSASSEM